MAFEKKRTWLDGRAVVLHSPVVVHYSVFLVFFPFKLELVPGRNNIGVTQMQHRAHCFKTLNFPVEILPVLLFSCSVHDAAKICLFTLCASPLQTDRDPHLHLTFSISASEWVFQSYEDNSYIPLLFCLVKAVLRSYSKCQIDRYTKIAGPRPDFLLLTLGFLLKHKNLNSLLVHELDTWSRI